MFQELLTFPKLSDFDHYQITFSAFTETVWSVNPLLWVEFILQRIKHSIKYSEQEKEFDSLPFSFRLKLSDVENLDVSTEKEIYTRILHFLLEERNGIVKTCVFLSKLTDRSINDLLKSILVELIRKSSVEENLVVVAMLEYFYEDQRYFDVVRVILSATKNNKEIENRLLYSIINEPMSIIGSKKLRYVRLEKHLRNLENEDNLRTRVFAKGLIAKLQTYINEMSED
ncbi:MAG: hypothetical protein ACFFBD_22910 [Candidatus Hodarchaeota archaeon]